MRSALGRDHGSVSGGRGRCRLPACSRPRKTQAAVYRVPPPTPPPGRGPPDSAGESGDGCGDVFAGSGPEAGPPAEGVPVAEPVAAPPGPVGEPGASVAAAPGLVGVVALGAAADPLLSCLVEPCAVAPDEVPSASKSPMTKALFMKFSLFT